MNKSIDLRKYKKITPKLLAKKIKKSWDDNEGDIARLILMTKKQHKDFSLKHTTQISKKEWNEKYKNNTSFGTVTIKGI